MAQVIQFFAKQAYLGSSTGVAGVHFSEIFDIGNYPQLSIFLQIYTYSVATGVVTGIIEDTSDPCFADGCWSGHTPIALTAAGGSGMTRTVLTGLQRYVRAKITISAVNHATVAMVGEARDSS